MGINKLTPEGLLRLCTSGPVQPVIRRFDNLTLKGGVMVKKAETKLTARFVDNKNGTITDIKTGLTWVKNPHTDLPEKFKGE